MYSASLLRSPICRKKVASLVVAVVVDVDVVFRYSRGRNARERRKCAFGVVMGIMYVRGYVAMQDESGREVGVVVVGREFFRGCLGGWQPKQSKRALVCGGRAVNKGVGSNSSNSSRISHTFSSSADATLACELACLACEPASAGLVRACWSRLRLDCKYTAVRYLQYCYTGLQLRHTLFSHFHPFSQSDID